MEKKEAYRHILPHFQQPGQAYFVTWNLIDAIPPKALEKYTRQLEALGAAIFNRREITQLEPESPKLKQEYYLVRKKYMKAYDDLLDVARNPIIDLSRMENTEIMIQALNFWNGKRLTNLAYSVMPNHVHWVFQVFEKDTAGKPVYLQDILQSVKRYSSNQINKVENREGALWQKESFDTTIRDDKHLYYAIEYTLQNPIKAGLVADWRNWKGTWTRGHGF
jgi:putative transposase